MQILFVLGCLVEVSSWRWVLLFSCLIDGGDGDNVHLTVPKIIHGYSGFKNFILLWKKNILIFYIIYVVSLLRNS